MKTQKAQRIIGRERAPFKNYYVPFVLCFVPFGG